MPETSVQHALVGLIMINFSWAIVALVTEALAEPTLDPTTSKALVPATASALVPVKRPLYYMRSRKGNIFS